MLDPSEVDRLVQLTGLPVMRLVDWKNRSGEPFQLRCTPQDKGLFSIELNTPEATRVPGVVPIVHGDYDSRREEGDLLVYTSLPGNTMGQSAMPDGRLAFAVAYDLTEFNDAGNPLFKVYFGTAAEWFVKNVYHQKWNELREARGELEPDATPKPEPPAAKGKERGRNPRDRKRAQERQEGGRQGGGHRGRGHRGRGRG